MSATDRPSSVPFLDALPAATRQQLERLATTRDFPPGTRMFQEGTPHDDIHLIVAGHVRLEMFVPGRGRLPLLTLGPGDLVGWSPLFPGSTMTATAVALEPVRTLSLNGRGVADLCQSDHEVGYHVMRQIVRVLSNRLLATRLQLLDLFTDHQPSTGNPLDSEC